MKINNVILKTLSATAIAAVALVSSCKEEERVNAQDIATLTEEAIADAYYEDADDVSSVTVYDGSNPSAGGRVDNGRAQEITDGRLGCADISWTESSTAESGQITIDFSGNDNGYCTFRGNRREGKIILTYSNGPRGNDGFTVVQTFENYKINGIELRGTRTVVRNATTPDTNIKHAITLEDGEAIWPNGQSITRESQFTRIWVRDAEDVRVELDGNASGTTRRGTAYTMNITKTMVYRKECIVNDGIYMGVQGTKLFTTDEKQIGIDYGNGVCDRNVTISVNGISRQVDVQ